jgi:hypothetical protein
VAKSEAGNWTEWPTVARGITFAVSALSNLGTWLATAAGWPPSQAMVVARGKLDRRGARAARRAVRRGTAAATPDQAHYAIALAGRAQQRTGSRAAVSIVILIALLSLGLAVSDAVSGNFDAGSVLLAALAAGFAWLAWRTPRQLRAAARSEAANRAFLEATEGAYEPLAPDLPVAPTPGVLVGFVASFVWYAAVFGAAMVIVDGQTMTIGQIWERGWLFATVMTVVNAALSRRAEAATRGPSPAAR